MSFSNGSARVDRERSWGCVLQLATIYVPALNPIFHTEPLTAIELGICLLLSAVVFVAVEIEKWLVRRGRLYR